MVTSTLVGAGIGLFTTVVGALGLSGRLLRIPSSTLAGNYSSQLLVGAAFLLGSVAVSLEDGSWVAGVLIVPTIVLFVIGMYAFTIRPPAWSQPQWQREMDEAARRSRR